MQSLRKQRALMPNTSLKLSDNGVARWTAGAKWGEAPAPDGQRATPLALSLSEVLGISARCSRRGCICMLDIVLLASYHSKCRQWAFLLRPRLQAL